jgi:hypothetical protein
LWLERVKLLKQLMIKVFSAQIERQLGLFLIVERL